MAGQQESVRCRFCRDRRRVGGVRDRRAAERGPGDAGSAARSRRRGQKPLDPHPVGLWQDLCRPVGQLVLRDRARSRRGRPQGVLAARQGAWAARRRSTAWSISAARPRISTIGASSATPAGRLTTCCRISSAPSTRPAAPTHSTAPAARSAFPTCPTVTRSAKPLSRARWRLAFRATTISTAPARTGSAITRRRRATARRCSTAVGYLRPAMSRPNLRVVTNALTEKIIFDGRRATGVHFPARAAKPTDRARRDARSSCAAARSTRRNC